uniref:Uncharacterized protein n=1 Tax=Labrus bergylta TaxID=56723 RepID=A0A3Q3E4N4_9LABR
MSGRPRNEQNCFGVCSPVLSPVPPAGRTTDTGKSTRLLELAPGLVVLPRVPLALAGRDHGDFVRSRAAVLALQLDALRAGLVVDAPPVLAAAPATPGLPAVGTADPVLKHLSRKTLAGAHQLLDGVDAGAVAVRDVLS